VGSDYPVEGIESVIFFDGVCNLCNGAVNTIIKYDKKLIFKFASLQSEFAKRTLNIEPSTKFESIVLLKNNKLFYRSNAIIEIGRELSGVWKFAPMLKVFPGFFRDLIYNTVARYRYSFFGKRDTCIVPTPQLTARFLD